MQALPPNRTAPQQHCEAHLSRAAVKIPAFRLGLCRACFFGKPLDGPAEEVGVRKNVRRVRRCCIQGCERRIYRSNATGICTVHQNQGFVSTKRLRSKAAANRKWRLANLEETRQTARRYAPKNSERL